MDNKFNKWNRWLKVIELEITQLSIRRYVFREVQEIIKNNPKIQKPSAFYDFLWSVYIASSLIGIRRQVKIDYQSISFARLLKEISGTPQVISRTRFVKLFPRAISDFDNFFAGKVGSHVDPNLVKSDLNYLKNKVKKCEAYADMRVAHHDDRSLRDLPNFGDLDECIDLLEKLLKKYILLFRAEQMISVLPVFQYDWKAIFKEVWLP